jgi:hypothetical protein
MVSSRFLRVFVPAFFFLCASFGLQAQSAKYIDALKYYQQGDTAEALKLLR